MIAFIVVALKAFAKQKTVGFVYDAVKIGIPMNSAYVSHVKQDLY